MYTLPVHIFDFKPPDASKKKPRAALRPVLSLVWRGARVVETRLRGSRLPRMFRLPTSVSTLPSSSSLRIRGSG